MTNHTLAPWAMNKIIGTDEGEGWVILHSGAAAGRLTRLDRFKAGQFSEADARLITAAPAMLATLQGIVTLAGAMGDHYEPRNSADETGANLRHIAHIAAKCAQLAQIEEQAQ